jgi:maleate isomerase
MGVDRNGVHVGVLVPYTNINLEADFAMFGPPGVSFHYARLGGYDIDAIPDAQQMAGMGMAELDEPLRLIGGVRPRAILYGCTSATLTHGNAFDSTLAQTIEVQTGAASVTAAGSIVAALRRLNLDQVAFASPYVGEINTLAKEFLSEAGVRTVSAADVGVSLDNYGQGKLTPDQVFELGCRADSPQAQALVLSCTDMRSMEAIARLESTLNKPVITSNQAMLYAVCELLDITYTNKACGKLFAPQAVFA